MQPVLQARLGPGGQEAGEGLQRAGLGHDQGAARAEQAEDPGQGLVGVGHVVQGHRGPDQVGRAELGPGLVQVGRYDVDPAVQAQFAGPVAQPGQPVRGQVDRGHPGLGEPAQQGERTGPGPGAQVDDAGHRRLGGGGDPGGGLVQVPGQDLAVQVEQFGQGFFVVIVFAVPGGVTVFAVTGSGVMAGGVIVSVRVTHVRHCRSVLRR